MVRIGLIACAVVALASWASAHEGAGTWPHAHDEEGAARPVRLERHDTLGGEFSLPGTSGQAVRLSDFRGQVVLLFFGYTYCPDACPLTVAKVTQAMTLLGQQRQQVRFVFITTDAERDTPERLREWLGGFDPEFVGLRGSDAELAAVDKRYGVFHVKLPPESSAEAYQVNHTSRLFLIDQDGTVRYLFTPDQPAESIVEGVRLLLRRRPWWARVLDWVKL
jgi:protein SCO1/2